LTEGKGACFAELNVLRYDWWRGESGKYNKNAAFTLDWPRAKDSGAVTIMEFLTETAETMERE